MRGMADPPLPRVFAKRHIADVMPAIFNRPMPAPQLFKQRGRRRGGGQAGQAISDRLPYHPRLELDHAGGAAEDLADVGPGELVVEGRTALQRAGF